MCVCVRACLCVWMVWYECVHMCVFYGWVAYVCVWMGWVYVCVRLRMEWVSVCACV